MKKIKILSLAIALTSASSLALAMQALDEEQLGSITGEGLGTTVEDLAIGSADYGIYPDLAFKLKLKLTEDAITYNPDGSIASDPNNYVIMSELRLHKSVNEIARLVGETDEDYTTRVRRTGGFIGTVDDPYIQEQMRLLNINGTDHVALLTEWPGADINRAERTFFNYAATGFDGSQWSTSLTGANIGGVGKSAGSIHHYRGMPANFFNPAVNGVAVGNFFDKADEYQSKLDTFENRLDAVSSKFDMHFRVDAITDDNRNKDLDAQFLGYIDLIGFRYYQKYEYNWADPVRGNVTYGVEGLRADELRITASPDGKVASQLSMKGLDMYLPSGTAYQPHSMGTVKYAQVQRGTWKQPVYLPATAQLRIETAALPASQVQAPQGYILIQSIHLGDPNNPEIITGYEDVALRDRSGNIVKDAQGKDVIFKNVAHRAFVPKTVIYNDLVDQYNVDNPGANIPNIPNQNVIEIRGLETQRMVMTTQDLGR